MADIKTRDVVKGSIKTIDKAAIASERMKHAYISTKEKAEHSTHASQNSVDEYASDKFESAVDTTVHEGIYQFDKAGRKGVQNTRENYHKAKDGIQTFKEKRASQSLKRQSVNRHGKGRIKTVEQTQKTVKESARSAGKKTIKTTTKGATKTASKSVKTAEKTAKTTIKTTQQAAKTAQKTAQASAKAAQRAAQAAKATAKATVVAVKAAVKATIAAVKAIIAGTKALISAIAAGGWVAVVVIIVLCLVALLLGSVFGIFFSGEDSGTGMTMQTVVQEINTEYDNELDEIVNGTSHDVLEMSGSRAVWKDVLAVYSVKVNTDPDNPQEVATMDENKKQLLKDIFWEMNSISSRTETKSETVVEESDDGNGNIVQTETTVTRTYLYITVSHKTVEEMATQYGFNEEQKGYLAELLKEENNSLWSAALYGIRASDDQIVTVALSQVGNVGGQPYWSWYGFGGRVEWCACFVSWCANECGYIDIGVIPKFALCSDGANWFKNRGQWADNSHEPVAGTIIFFDWEQDGETDHVGIVQKCENGIVYTVEGNSGDTCRTKTYSVGSASIYGYGIPAY
ncbi:MAG: CHAP domain-containing protein [Parabacteroides sp.]|nr:CHAP domain-containing protein [Parabacteroides sp.]